MQKIQMFQTLEGSLFELHRVVAVTPRANPKFPWEAHISARGEVVVLLRQEDYLRVIEMRGTL